MNIDEYVKDNKPHYVIRWNQDDVDYFLAGCPQDGNLVATASNRRFIMYPAVSSDDDSSVSREFTRLSHGAALYGAMIDVWYPSLDSKDVGEQIDELDTLVEDTFKKTLKETTVPIVIDGAYEKPSVMGYVSMEIE